MRYVRYGRRGAYADKDKDCPQGQHWCPQTEKCVPIGQGRGRGGGRSGRGSGGMMGRGRGGGRRFSGGPRQ
jgi:hypothetical protein